MTLEPHGSRFWTSPAVCRWCDESRTCPACTSIRTLTRTRTGTRSLCGWLFARR